MAIYLVRHARAGSRSAWTEPDVLRPLDSKGHLQAQAIAAMLSPTNPPVILSSPATRCVQTLEPLAEACGLSVVTDIRIQEYAPFEPALALLEDIADGAVLCSHGDVIPEVVDALIRRGMELSGPAALRKASLFVLHRENGRFVRAEYVDPPTVSGE